ncbi:MAG: sugar ABC transporter substrate-binding protein [Verrucomicrobia bacterium]|nr:sugar ABC transporter substrate-binding protein [Verrucomicrobiota bacterium]
MLTRNLTIGGCLFILVAASLQAKDTISFWVRDSDQAVVQPLVKAYNETGEATVRLTVIPAGQFVTKFATSIAGGSPPDVVATDLIYVPAFASAGQMTDITDRAKALPFFDKLSPSHIRLSTWENRLYSVPFSAEASVLVYNKDLFRKAKLDPEKPPTNFADFENAAKQITALGGGIKGFYFSGSSPGGMVFTSGPLVWASGGELLSPDGKSAMLENPAVGAMLELYRRVWDAKLVPEGAKSDNGTSFFSTFASGKVGMCFLGAFSIGILKEKYPNIDFGVAPLFGQTGGTSSFAGGDSIGIPKGTKNVEAAWKFINWCLGDKVQIEQFAMHGSLPVRTDIGIEELKKVDPRYLVCARMMAEGRTPFTVKYNELFNDQNGPWLAMFQEAVFGKGVDAAVKNGQTRFTAILNSR